MRYARRKLGTTFAFRLSNRSPDITMLSNRSISLLPAIALCTTLASAQQQNSIGIFVARNDALPGAPKLGGLAFTSYTGPLGLRLSGGLHVTQDGNFGEERPPKLGVGAWTADADVVLAPFRTVPILTMLLAGFSPNAFVGIGGHGVQGTSDTSIATWSYGAGVTRSLLSVLGVEASARYRMPLRDNQVLPAGFKTEWEYRAGITIGFGNRPSSSSRRSASSARVERTRRDTRNSSGIPRSTPAPANSASAARVIDTADDYLGTRYRYGGTSPTTGFDCSGFVQHVYARHDLKLPRTSRQMASAGSSVTPRVSALRTGDLMFFAQNGSTVDHVAIYAGGNRIIHSSSSGAGVRYDDLDSRRGEYFVTHLIAARRVLGAERALVAAFGAELGKTLVTDLDPPDRAPAP
ncbi:MAG: C40 family peptidase [Gemmatimonadota bacterium]|nr:C40 family peptidase [Gemmatimonadota bacterium]